jgi:hypothetical protein
MATRLDKPLKRELELEGKLYTVTLSQEGVRIVPKGRRKGQEIGWTTLLSGDADLSQQLKLSVAMFDSDPEDGARR